MAKKSKGVKIPDSLIEGLVFETFGLRRFTQDSPVRPDVWLRFLKLAKWRLADPGDPGDPKSRSAIALDYRVPLILTPKLTMEKDGRQSGHAGLLVRRIRHSFGDGFDDTKSDHVHQIEMLRMAATTRHVAIDVTFDELVHHLLPLTDWWRRQPKVDLKKIETDITSKVNKNKTISEILSDMDNTESYRFAALAAIIKYMITQPIDDETVNTIASTLAPASYWQNVDIEDKRLENELFSQNADDGKTEDKAAKVKLIEELGSAYASILRQQVQVKTGSALTGRLGEELARANIWSIHLNRATIRQADTKIAKKQSSTRFNSSSIVKADAARRLFNISTADLIWAVVDTGIDATHPAFQLIEERTDRAQKSDAKPSSRVVETLDFTHLQDLLSCKEEVLKETTDRLVGGAATEAEKADKRFEINELCANLRNYAKSGSQIDWSLIEILIRHDPMTAPVPTDGHGTHVAGILGGNIPPIDSAESKKTVKSTDLPLEPFEGVCPDIKLYDLRVLGKNKRVTTDAGSDGSTKASQSGSDEFTILAALDYIAWKNRDPMLPTIHGVNLSLAIPFEVGSHACGRTPVCDACDRLVWSGTVVVAAAGNSGFDDEHRQSAFGVGYQNMSITDPGNSQEVITVGSTHYKEPHTYGVSYFSSRGPTGDGRIKPDIVAPGEKIRSTVPQRQMLVMDGTSMAAPHVSGVCALLMGRHTELTGEPEKIKKIIMDTATDLGRERNMQGAGLIDALRALQSV